MQAVIFTGLPGSGKSSFYVNRFLWTHLRINLDMLRTRTREERLLDFCIGNRQAFVVDNTNPTIDNRLIYIDAAKSKRFSAIGYYFAPDVEGCLRRNAGRSGKQQIPDIAIHNIALKLSEPTMDEGFDELYRVELESGGFVVRPL